MIKELGEGLKDQMWFSLSVDIAYGTYKVCPNKRWTGNMKEAKIHLWDNLKPQLLDGLYFILENQTPVWYRSSND